MFKIFTLIFCFIQLTAVSQVFENVTSGFDLSSLRMSIYYGGGISAEDFDNDGDIDIAVSSDQNYSARILRNEENAGFSEILIQLDFQSRASLWIDYNGDHLLDLFFAGDCLGEEEDCESPWALLKQMPNGSFEDVTVEAGLSNVPFYEAEALGGISAGDINSDGFLDIVAAHFRGPTIIFKNQRDGTFKVIMDPQNLGEQKIWQSIIFDLDRDGFEDIYQAVDFQKPNQFWKHNGDGIFKDVASEYGLDHRWDDMGIALGDYDADGDLDLYISCIEARSLGSSETVQGNELLANDNLNYQGIGIEAGVSDLGWGWGVTFIDGDKDGYPDLAGTNGLLYKDQSKYFKNNGDGSFDDLSEQVNFNDSLMATSLISLDFDRDGDLDMIQTLKASVPGNPLVFLKNVSDYQDNNYVVVKPRMNGPNHWAIGALIKVKTPTKTQVRPITAGISLYGQEPAEAFFGLGEESQIDEIEVVWPGGGITKITNVEANQVILIEDTGALHPPLNVHVNSIDATSLEITWDVYSIVDGFTLERSLNADMSSMEVVEIDGDLISYTDEGLETLTQYYYRLRSIKEENASRSSLVSSAYTSGINIQTPGQLAYTVTSATSILISWADFSDNEEAFRLQRSGDRNFSNFIEYNLSENSNMFSDNNLEPVGEYFYRIQAYSSIGISDFSEVLRVVVDYLAPLGADSQEFIEIYPNPTNDSFAIDSDYTMTMISLLDISGKEILSKKINDKRFESGFELSSGTYLVKILFENKKTAIHKLVVD